MLRLRPVGPDDEAAVLDAHRALLADNFTFALNYHDGDAWPDYVKRLSEIRQGRSLSVGMVPSTLLLAVVDKAIVGRASIRHELNDELLRVAGHIGYSVLPEYRRRGYATEILRQSLVIIRSLGVEEVLVTCDDGNVGSAKTIEACGGVLENLVDNPPGPAKRRYWIS
jgi:predicted acetyltransferase